ncbi:Pilin/Flagellin, FlaG/FlaF family [Halapricum desulfuricans]|uniref:Pilin/Flagellin, FlaG/FlaF family n=1 Tax=Halapricum desulfuricans TaxID=2841257 RepID=A0A897NHZ3_9EURY|nr:type IV pilin N-terminal domain-containing protein [Halapricum desulfuricans]QSG11055.1 Pilin/Flagellin, FlaG/FlaF family [Halapricum desulfuricans]
MHEFRTDDTAVSPVIGVILMVAITVLLASTAAVFFLQFGDEAGTSTPPTAAFETDYSDGSSDTVTFTHESGDSLDTSKLTIVVNGANVSNERHEVSTIVTQSELSAGSVIEVSNSTLPVGSSVNVDFSEATIKLTWEGSAATSSTTLAEWTGPDA